MSGSSKSKVSMVALLVGAFGIVSASALAQPPRPRPAEPSPGEALALKPRVEALQIGADLRDEARVDDRRASARELPELG